MPGQDLPDINAILTEAFNYHNSCLPFKKSFFFKSVGFVVTPFPLHRF